MGADTGLSAMLDELAGREHELTADIVATIRSEIPGYHGFPYAEQVHDVHLGTVAILDGLRSRRPPSPGAIEHARAMGRRRARFPLALADSIEAYHIAYRELWGELLRLAKQHDPDLTTELTGVVALLWNWVHRLSAAFAGAHVEESRNRTATQLALRRRFVAGLDAVGAGDDVDAGLARSLGYDPDGDFVVACSTSRDEVGIERINAALAGVAGTAHGAAGAGGRAVLVAQHCRRA